MANGMLDALTKLAAERMLLDVEPLDPGFVADPGLQDDVEWAIHPPTGVPGPVLEDHAFAVVDLTADPMKPAYAGWRDTEQREIGSLAKLLALYGAYRMRDDLGALAHALSIDNITALAASGRADYRQLGMSVETPVKKRPRIERMFTVDNSANVEFALQPMNDAALNLAHGGWPTRFDRTVPCTTGPCDPPDKNTCDGRSSKLGADAALNPELQAIKFRELLSLMAGWSDNVAAGVIIQALGFPYLWKLANASGLFSRSWAPLTRNDKEPSGPGGLFLGKDYNCGRWKPPQPEAPASPLSAGNARSIATLMTMLGQDRLFTDPASHFGMREMLRKPPAFDAGARGEDSPLGMGMADAYGEPALNWSAAQLPWDGAIMPVPAPDPTTPLAVSKIGLLAFKKLKAVSNALLVRSNRLQRSSGTDITVTAVLVGLCNGDDQKELLKAFGRRMAVKLDARHHIT